MSIIVEKKDGHDQMRIFIFQDQRPVFPNQKNLFSNADDAAQGGFYAAATLLKHARIQSINNLVMDGSDRLEIALNDGYSWDSLVKASTVQRAGNVSQEAPKTVEEKYVELLLDFTAKRKLLFKDPATLDTDAEILIEINNYLTQSFQKAVDSAGQKTKVANGQRLDVYDVLKGDNGNVVATSFANGTLKVTFKGNCSSDCRNGSTKATETGLTANLKDAYPFIRHIDFEA